MKAMTKDSFKQAREKKKKTKQLFFQRQDCIFEGMGVKDNLENGLPLFLQFPYILLNKHFMLFNL